MIGNRRTDIAADEYYLLKPGEYMKGAGDRQWWARTPVNASFARGAIANLERHDVTEHADGTITVSPSILVSAAPSQSWHGFLRRGVWTVA